MFVYGDCVSSCPSSAGAPSAIFREQLELSGGLPEPYSDVLDIKCSLLEVRMGIQLVGNVSSRCCCRCRRCLQEVENYV